jgi:sugar (pentulose or hexulose) kinase
LGVLPGLDAVTSLVKVESIYEPELARAEVYQHNYEVFTELYSRLKDLM